MSESLSPPPEDLGLEGDPQGEMPNLPDEDDALNDQANTKPGGEASPAIDAQDTATDPSGNPIEKPSPVPYQSDAEATSAMQEQREKQGLASNKEEDSRWQEAYNAAYQPARPPANYGKSPIYDDLHIQDREQRIAEAKRNDIAARQAADEALRTADPDAYNGYDRYGKYDTAISDPAFSEAFPHAGDPRHNRETDVAKIDEWIAAHPEKAFQYRTTLGDMRDAAVQGASDRGEPIPPADEQRLRVIKATGKKISSLPFYDMYGTRELLRSTGSAADKAGEAPDHTEDDTQTGHDALDKFGSLVEGNQNLYGLVAAAEDPQAALSFVHESMNEYTALLDTDTANAESIGLAVKNELQNQHAAALRANNKAEAYKLDLRIALIDALLQERQEATSRQDTVLAA